MEAVQSPDKTPRPIHDSMRRATHTNLIAYNKETGEVIPIATKEESTKDLAKRRKCQCRAAQRAYRTYDYLQTNEESSQTNLNTLWDAGRRIKRTIEALEKEQGDVMDADGEQDREECLWTRWLIWI
jgi:hypothetical protein